MVIAIIGLLAGIVLVSLNSTRAKARDAKRKADLQQLSTALNLFYDKNRYMPANRKGQGQCQNDPDGYYSAIMQEIVDAGFLPQIPKDPGQNQYCYYLYSGSTGALIKTNLETQSGVSPCWLGQSGNWCTNQNDPSAWCVCITY